MNEFTGWLLDLYPDPCQPGVAIWLVGEDGNRYRLHQSFSVTFYAAGEAQRLRALWKYLASQPGLTLSRTERRDLFSPSPLSLLAVQVNNPIEQTRLFHQLAELYPDLTYFDADIPLPLRYAAEKRVFPMARCSLAADDSGNVLHIHPLETPWELDPAPPTVRILWLEPDNDPLRSPPRRLLLRIGSPGKRTVKYRLALHPERVLLINLRSILERHDPDLLITLWGDTWLLPYLIERAKALDLQLPLNREAGMHPSYRAERSYFSYGQVIHRGRQVLLYGRCHIDSGNAMLWDDYELEGSMEVARVTGLPLQTAARVSPGTGISAMQMVTALRMGILVPWRKQQVEDAKTALDMFASDQGGMVYQPLAGLHYDVAGIDFVSMYPGIMVHFNISPETVGGRRPAAGLLEQIPSPDGQELPGLVPQTLEPLLEKRLALKKQLSSLPRWHPARRAYKARSSAHKWLLVTCFGYLGYKNARFGKIESHEAVTAYGREALLRAKEVAEDMGFTILHMYVDGLWVKKPGANTAADIQPLLDEIYRRTGLPIVLDGIYRWVAFLPSRLDGRISVANRYFGTFQDGSLKVRGIEARRGDTPLFIARLQMRLLELIAGDPAAPPAPETLRRALFMVRWGLYEIRSGKVPLEELLVTQKLSREIGEYHQPSPSARAATQLETIGRTFRAGQYVRFLYTRDEIGVHAWDLPEPLDPHLIDRDRYIELLLRAASSVLEPFGIEKSLLVQVTRWEIGVQLSFPAEVQLSQQILSEGTHSKIPVESFAHQPHPVVIRSARFEQAVYEPMECDIQN